MSSVHREPPGRDSTRRVRAPQSEPLPPRSRYVKVCAPCHEKHETHKTHGTHERRQLFFFVGFVFSRLSWSTVRPASVVKRRLPGGLKADSMSACCQVRATSRFRRQASPPQNVIGSGGLVFRFEETRRRCALATATDEPYSVQSWRSLRAPGLPQTSDFKLQTSNLLLF